MGESQRVKALDGVTVRTGGPRQVVDRSHLLHREEVQDALLLTLKLLRGVAVMCMLPD